MSRDLAIDLGTANTLVWVRGEGLVAREPTLVAVEQRSGQVHEVGRRAYDAVARSRGQLVIERPLAGGVVTDFEMTAAMLRIVFERMGVTRFTRSQVLICVPVSVTEVERRALEGAARRAGAARVFLLEEPMAAAIGADLPVQDAVGSMVVDIGGGNTEVALISLGGVVASRSVRVGGYDLDAALQRHLRERYGVAIGDRTAEDLKVALGSAYPGAPLAAVEVRGRDLGTGGARVVPLTAEEVRGALEQDVTRIVRTVVDALSDCPPELSQDVVLGGMLLVGGGAMLRGLAERIAAETQVRVAVAADPLDAVVVGAGRTLESAERLDRLFANR